MPKTRSHSGRNGAKFLSGFLATVEADDEFAGVEWGAVVGVEGVVEVPILLEGAGLIEGKRGCSDLISGGEE